MPAVQSRQWDNTLESAYGPGRRLHPSRRTVAVSPPMQAKADERPSATSARAQDLCASVKEIEAPTVMLHTHVGSGATE